jgi:glycogen phosphorylase
MSEERFAAAAPLPDRVSRLDELACDLWWSWHYQARDVFRYLDYPLWRLTAHNPVRMLRIIPRERLEQASKDPAFLRLYDNALALRAEAYSNRNPWWRQTVGEAAEKSTIAYFSAEFALHQSLPIYAGGLGVLAGDTCKEANDLGVPFVGVGFMYPQGYFHQMVSAEGLAAGGLRAP